MRQKPKHLQEASSGPWNQPWISRSCTTSRSPGDFSALCRRPFQSCRVNDEEGTELKQQPHEALTNQRTQHATSHETVSQKIEPEFDQASRSTHRHAGNTGDRGAHWVTPQRHSRQSPGWGDVLDKQPASVNKQTARKIWQKRSL